MRPGSATVVSAGAAGERTGIDCAGLPVPSSAGRRAERGAGREGPGVPGRWFWPPGSDRTGRQAHYRDMESGAGEAASARGRRPARSGSGIPPPPSTAQGCSSIPPTALASPPIPPPPDADLSSIPSPPVTALASCSPIPPPPGIARLAPADDAV